MHVREGGVEAAERGGASNDSSAAGAVSDQDSESLPAARLSADGAVTLQAGASSKSESEESSDSERFKEEGASGAAGVAASEGGGGREVALAGGGAVDGAGRVGADMAQESASAVHEASDAAAGDLPGVNTSAEEGHTNAL